MDAKIVSYRRGRHTGYTNQLIVTVDGVADIKGAGAFVGKKILWGKGVGKKVGVVVKQHGRSGALLVRFGEGLPGQAVGTNAQIVE
jgi:ribosomal protein L35AE/L33A